MVAELVKSNLEFTAKLASSIEGEVLADRFSLGRYSTDASIYQIEPIAVVTPKTDHDVATAMGLAREFAIPVLGRGAGTSQCGQTVNRALVIDHSKHLKRVLSIDSQAQIARVEPGVVLDQLNRDLRPHGLWFPVDVSTSSRATLGGMAGNNSCGARSIRYGTMRDNVLAIDARLADGTVAQFGAVTPDLDGVNQPSRAVDLMRELLTLGRREAAEIARRFPNVMRRVGGYNIDALTPTDTVNFAHLLVGSEGTLAMSRSLDLKLSPLPRHRALGICHFPSFYQAMEFTQHIVKLKPTAVELVDRTLLELAREIPLFQATLQEAVRGAPEAILLVEFAAEDEQTPRQQLRELDQLLADLGLSDAVVNALEPRFQSAVWELRKASLNIVMSMKSSGKPISFIEDCAVDLADLAEYTERLSAVFKEHGTTGTWYAHASVGCLHVRPVLNLKLDEDVKKMRAVAEAAFEMVREYRGSHSGEHGDGIVRSEFHRPMFGDRMVANFAQVKHQFDPDTQLNPGKIVDPPKMDDRTLMRFKPGYRSIEIKPVFDWSAWDNGDDQSQGFAAAIEMCNNNGACRKIDAAVMCPSFRVTGDEQHVTRGRANTLRLAISGQLGENALTDPQMRATMQLCVGCKGCKRECPTGVDMAKMKLEIQHLYVKRHGLSLHERLIAFLPRYAPWLAAIAPLANLPQRIPIIARAMEVITGFSAQRPLPRWKRNYFNPNNLPAPPPAVANGQTVVLLADTFNRYFEPENLHAATAVLVQAGYQVVIPDSKRPLCCGRTYLTAGLADKARTEQQRVLDTLLPYINEGAHIVGLEPSCLLTLRDEMPTLLANPAAKRLAESALLFEEFIVREVNQDRFGARFSPRKQDALLHGHCHQKAFAAMSAVEQCLRLIPDLNVQTIESSCCGMAGAFGYHRETVELSRRMGELALLPAVRAADNNTLIVADGTSCRHQIDLETDRQAVHVARVLADNLLD